MKEEEVEKPNDQGSTEGREEGRDTHFSSPPSALGATEKGREPNAGVCRRGGKTDHHRFSLCVVLRGEKKERGKSKAKCRRQGEKKGEKKDMKKKKSLDTVSDKKRRKVGEEWPRHSRLSKVEEEKGKKEDSIFFVQLIKEGGYQRGRLAAGIVWAKRRRGRRERALYWFFIIRADI